MAVGRDGDRRLGGGLSRGITGTGAPTGLAVRIPLRKAAASGRTEHTHAHDRMNRRRRLDEPDQA